MKQKILVVVLAAICILTSFSNSVYAKKSKPASKPSFSYGTKLSVVNFDKTGQKGPFPKGFYQVKDVSYYYNWDCDEFACYSSKAGRKLSTSNTSKVAITAGASAKFAGFIEGEFSYSNGDEWTKTSEVTYDADAGYNYVLWSANVVADQSYYYDSNRKKLYTVRLPRGHKQWFFRERL